MILIVDNYDSFVHNLARYINRLGVATRVVRNDTLSVAAARQCKPQAILFSPGPCTPDKAGNSLKLIAALKEQVPMLGVCLGHQAIAQTFGARVVRASAPCHGRATPMQHTQRGLFAKLPSPMQVGRYHSLIVDRSSLPDELEATAWTDDGVVMAFEHRHLPIAGVQFHPESILTPHGYSLLANFLQMADIPIAADTPKLAESELQSPPSDRPLPTQPVTF